MFSIIILHIWVFLIICYDQELVEYASLMTVVIHYILPLTCPVRDVFTVGRFYIKERN